MPAPTHARSHRPAADGVEIRLSRPGARVGLQVCTRGGAAGGEDVGDPALGQLIERTFQLLSR